MNKRWMLRQHTAESIQLKYMSSSSCCTHPFIYISSPSIMQISPVTSIPNHRCDSKSINVMILKIFNNNNEYHMGFFFRGVSYERLVELLLYFILFFQESQLVELTMIKEYEIDIHWEKIFSHLNPLIFIWYFRVIIGYSGSILSLSLT